MNKKIINFFLSAIVGFNPLLVSASQSPNIIRVTSPVIFKDSAVENWVEATPVFSPWEMSTPYGCSAWTPSPSFYTESTEFEQTATDCSIDHSRTRQNREFETYTEKYRNAGAPITEELTYTNQSARRDYRISYSEWINDGEPYGCSNWRPAPESYPAGVAFTQSADDCELNQSKTRSEYSRLGNTDWISEGSQSYTQTLTNKSDTREAIGIAEIPTISLDGPLTSVFAHEPFVLSWSEQNADTIQLRADHSNSGLATTDFAVSGTSYTVTPVAAGAFTFTATARNSAGEESASSYTVTALNGPVVDEFSADKTTVAAGGSLILSWSTSNADDLSISNGIGSVTGTSKTVTAGAQPGVQNYTLTASKTLNGITKKAERTIQVEVVAAPTLSMVSAPITNVFANAPFNLSWSGTDAVSYSIRGNVAASGVATSDVDLATSTAKSITPSAAGVYTYTITATNAVGESTSITQSVTVEANPTISAFTASPTTVTAGGNVTLFWTTTGTALSIDQSVGAVSGSSTSVAVGGSIGNKTYTMTASKTLNGVTRSTTASATVSIIAAPSVSINSAPATNVFANAAFTLGWTATGATNYKIRGNVAASGLATSDTDLGTSTNVSITPTAAGTYTYTLSAINAVGTTTTTTRSVTVEANPVISAFTASPATVTVGGYTTLSWSTTGTALSIDQSVGAVTGSSTNIGVGSTTGNKTYTLTASKTLNGVTRTTTASSTISIISAPTVSINTAPATNVFANAALTLGWTATGATNYKIRSNAASSGVSTSDVDLGVATSRVITPTAPGAYTYTVTASNAVGVTATATRTITVVADPVISSFVATPGTVMLGGVTTLNWATTGSALSIDQSVGAVSGSSAVVTVGTYAGNKTYTLYASSTLNGVTRSTSRSITISVTASCGYSYTANGDPNYWKFFAEGNSIWTGSIIPNVSAMWFSQETLVIPFSNPAAYNPGLTKVSNTEFHYNTGSRVWRIYRGAYVGGADGFNMYQVCAE